MNRQELEEAIFVLKGILDDEERHEEAFQDFFEQHKVAFEVLGYKAAYPRKRLLLDEEMKTKTGTSYLEPDFIVQRHNGLYEILELKTPQEKLLRDIANRETFYSKINEYISQVVTYSEYFDDRANRQWVQQNLQLDIHKDPDVVLVVGRDSGVDKGNLHKELRERTSRLTFLTYDDILTSLQFHYTNLYGRTDSLPGFSIHIVINVQKGSLEKRRYVYDCGISHSQDRFSVYLDDETLYFQVIDGSSISHHISSRIPESFFQSNEPFYVSCLFGSGVDIAILQIRINNSITAETLIADGLKVSPKLDAEKYTVGQDIEGFNAHGTMFGLFELVAYSNIPSLDDRMKLFAYFLNQISSSDYKQCIHFHEGACMYSSKMLEPPGNALRSKNEDLRPRLRIYPFGNN